jgi:DNA-binding transcriptional ArsR family regulator
MKLDTVKKLGGAEETESAPIPDELCASDTIDRQEIAELVKRLPDLQVSNYMVEIFKLLGDPTRLQIVVALLQRDLCVHDLVELLAQARSAKAEPPISQSAVSHQLRLMRQAQIVRAARQGQRVRYSLVDDHIRELVASSLAHAKE